MIEDVVDLIGFSAAGTENHSHPHPHPMDVCIICYYTDVHAHPHPDPHPAGYRASRRTVGPHKYVGSELIDH